MPKTEKQTESSQPHIFFREFGRYAHMGIGMPLAIAQVVLLAYYWPTMAQAYWDWAQAFMSEHQLSNEAYWMVHGTAQAWVLPIVLNTFFGMLYWLELPFVEQYKALEEPWPWKEDKAEWDRLFKKSLKVYFFNAFVITPLISTQFYMLDQEIPIDCSPDGMADPLKFLLQMLFCAMMEDLTFHMSHRVLHHPRLYPHIHKIHHEHKMTISISAQYAHPIEYIFGNLLPASVGVLLLGKRIHFTTAMMWYVLRTMESTEGHSGYEFPWSIFRVVPFGTDFAYHVYHHSHNIGNYSSFFSIWDTVFGSNKAYYDYLEDRRSQESLKSKTA